MYVVLRQNADAGVWAASSDGRKNSQDSGICCDSPYLQPSAMKEVELLGTRKRIYTCREKTRI